jgi:hypothetical protein
MNGDWIGAALAIRHNGRFTGCGRQWAQEGDRDLVFLEQIAVHTAWARVVDRRAGTQTRALGNASFSRAVQEFDAGIVAGSRAGDILMRIPRRSRVESNRHCLFSRDQWKLASVPVRLVVPWLIVSLLVLLPFLAAVVTTGPVGYAGGWTARAASYAFFEPFFAWGIILGLLWLFNSYCNSPRAWASFLSARAYGVYIIHPPVLVVVTRSLSHWGAPVLIKLVAAGTIGCAASVAVASLILLVPGARRVL